MIKELVKKMYRKLRSVYHKFRFYYSVNWIKTIYFNFKKFPFQTAKKLPVFFYGKVCFQSIQGEVIINGPIKTAMIGFGQQFEIEIKSKGIAQLSLYGKLTFNGHAQLGKDVILYIGQDGECEFGYMTCLGSSVKVFCTHKIVLGDWSRVGHESQIMDTNFHPMINTLTGEQYPLKGPIHIGSYNAFSNRISIMPNTRTPDYCVVASNSLCNKDYTNLGSNILLGGIPAKLLKNNYSRDWENEKEPLMKYLIVQF